MYTVLLVDDETSMLETLVQSIHWQQYGVDTVLTAADGMQALEVLSEHAVDLLITDIKMPHMDGLSLLREVRSIYPNTHCIILSAYEEFEYAKQAMQLGVENYLLKPLETEEMEESIERALDNIYSSRKISDRLFRDNVFTRWVSRCLPFPAMLPSSSSTTMQSASMMVLTRWATMMTAASPVIAARRLRRAASVL